MRRNVIARVVGVMCVLSIACAAAQAADFKEATHGPASLRIVEGVPVLHVYGTPAEMGEQQGRLIGAQAKRVHRQYFGRIFRPGGRDIGLRDDVLKLSRKMEASIPAAYVTEMKAMAKAAGMDYDDMLIANTVFDIKRSIFCTTFVATGDRSADGKPVFGRNLDFPTLGVAHKFSCVIVYHPKDGHAVASVTFPGLVGVLSGMNDAGVAAAVMEVHLQGAKVQATPYAMVFRSALTGAATTDDAVAAVRARARTATNNLMVCDANGAAACVELGMDKTAVRRPEGGLIYSTNHFLSEELTKPWVCWRIPRLKKATDGGKKLDEALAKRILADVAYKQLTMQSMVFRPASRGLLLATGEPPATKGEYVRLTADVLFPKSDETEGQ